MKKLLFILLIGLLSLGASAQKQNNKPSVVYSLPKTVLIVKVKVSKTIEELGPYYRYAERYLGMKDVIMESKTTYDVSKVQVHRKGLADETKTFQLKNGLVTLNSKGVICGINTGCKKEDKKEAPKSKKKKSDIDFLSNTVLTEDQLVANSTAKMAENAAKQIYRIRESRINLISGENEQLPADGESLKLMLKKLDQTEKALVELFTGRTTKKTIKEEFEIVPDKDIKDYVLFRISSLNGIVDKDDLSGSPVYINLTCKKNNTPPIKVKKGEGYFYNLPGLAKVVVSSGEKEYFNKDVEVSQHGSLQQIPCKALKNRKIKVKYNDKTGALISIGK